MRFDFDGGAFILGVGVKGELLAGDLLQNLFGDSVAEVEHPVCQRNVLQRAAGRLEDQQGLRERIDRIEFTAILTQTHAGIAAVIQTE